MTKILNFHLFSSVIPAKAGIQYNKFGVVQYKTPAFRGTPAGVTAKTGKNS